MRDLLSDLFAGYDGIRTFDLRWPTGFKSLFLAYFGLKSHVLYVVEDEEQIPFLRDEINSLGLPLRAVEGKDLDLACLRPDTRAVVLSGHDGDPGRVREFLSRLTFKKVKRGDRWERDDFVKFLIEQGYERVGYVEVPGEFAVRGGIVDIFVRGEETPYRVEFYGDKIESIRLFDPESQRSFKKTSSLSLPLVGGGGEDVDLFIIEERRVDLSLRVFPNRAYLGRFELLKEDVEDYLRKGYRVFFLSGEKWRRERFRDLLDAEILPGSLHRGFIFEDRRAAFFSDAEFVGRIPRKKRAIPKLGERIEDIEAIEPGDFVVHIDYGVARFEGLRKVEIQGAHYDCLALRYRDGQVFVPVYNLEKVQRFVQSGRTEPPLSSLSSNQWVLKRAKAQVSALEFARELLRIHAARKARKGFAFSPDTPLQKEIEARFPYEETEDQERAIEEVKKDMESDKAMDRLIAGEVGFGKTEVALRAAVKAVLDGKQVAFLVPTTILAFQHYRTFRSRLEGYPIAVEMISRLRRESEIREVLSRLEKGEVDIVIGTHRLLADDVKFRDLGLLIIDEEHRFGVAQKEKIRKIHSTVDTLRMTATPIPRTLYAALGRIYDLSVILTPPTGRQEVVTIVTEYNEDLIREAVTREIQRGGQVFYVYNRIETIKEVVSRLKEMFPFLRIEYSHGRMRREKLEDIFLRFYKGKIDLLVTTSIIEAGVDFPRANTLIVEKADLFGLAELHQLRGRVGRSDIKAYAYFLISGEISRKARRRLKALETYHHLGSGLKIALADLEIRGGGNLLGREQHGHAKAIGYELYFQLLEEAMSSLLGEEPQKEPEVLLEEVSALLPEDYVEESEVRVGFYRRIAAARSLDELADIKAELRDRFGPLPDLAEEVFFIASVKVLAREKGYDRIAFTPTHVRLYRGEKELNLRREVVLNVLGGKNGKKRALIADGSFNADGL